MALTFLRRLELAWRLAKLESHLEKLLLLKRPKKRHLLRDAAVVGGTFAAGAVVAGVVCGRRAWSEAASDAASAWNGDGTPAASPEQPQDIEIPQPH